MTLKLVCTTCGRTFSANRMNGNGWHRTVSLGPRNVGLVTVAGGKAHDEAQVLRATCASCACRLLAEARL